MTMRLDAADVARRLRDAARALDDPAWPSVFVTRDMVGSAFATLDQFCTTAEQMGTAPSFADQQAWYDGFLRR